mmetsp:Transcript_35872/g.112613  ORF Transcript_35872/g.112613 Transcript_35872/m.112613 type:complete len:201 (+) Transcript_35872:2052-2654(+)
MSSSSSTGAGTGLRLRSSSRMTRDRPWKRPPERFVEPVARMSSMVLRAACLKASSAWLSGRRVRTTVLYSTTAKRSSARSSLRRKAQVSWHMRSLLPDMDPDVSSTTTRSSGLRVLSFSVSSSSSARTLAPTTHFVSVPASAATRCCDPSSDTMPFVGTAVASATGVATAVAGVGAGSTIMASPSGVRRKIKLVKELMVG